MSEVDASRDTLLQELHARLERLQSPPEYEFQPMAMVSHARDYCGDPDRLKRYAETVVNARIMQFLSTTFIKTWFCLDEYIAGLDRGNPYACILSVRMQMEVFAVAYCVVDVVRSNSGVGREKFADRVILVDETLVTATYGTRNSDVISFLTDSAPSRLRNVTKKDEENWKALNILTRITRVAKDPKYSSFARDYEKLCEYLHPNILQNTMLLAQSARHPKFIKVSRLDPAIMDIAIAASLIPMAAASRGAVEIFENLTPPFV